MKKFIQVFGFHFKESIASKMSILVNVGLLVATLGFFGITHWLEHREAQVPVIVVINNSDTFIVDEAVLNSVSSDIEFSVQPLSALEQARLDLEASDIDSIFIISGNRVPVIDSISLNLAHLETSMAEARMIITDKIHQQYLTLVMEQENVSPQVVESLLTPISGEHEYIQSIEEVMSNLVINYLFGMALALIMLTYGNTIGSAILNEKTSRVMEVMISKVKPVYMMYAKILAVLGKALANILAIGIGFGVALILGWANMRVFNIFGTVVDLSQMGASTLIIGLIFLILGYFMYAMIYATAGALCSKQEDYNSIGVPLQFGPMIPFFFIITADLNSTLAGIMTYIPIFSPFVTFSRYTEGLASYLEVGISLALLILMLLVMSKFATKLYVGGVMHYSEKFRFKDIKKLMKG